MHRRFPILQIPNRDITLVSALYSSGCILNLGDLPYTVGDIFPPGDFAFHMRFRRGAIDEFYANQSQDRVTLKERRNWLDRDAADYAALLPEGEAILEEAIELAASLGVPPPIPSAPLERCIALGRVWQPDVLFLRTEMDSQPQLVGGCVCFPSSWSLAEKIGRTLDAIHEPVATFNAQFANPVKQFLARMKPGISWERINWGLSRSPELNQHPKRRLPRLDSSVDLREVWFRVEYQSLVALPKTQGILFGIRLVLEPLEQLTRDLDFALGLARALQTMPASVATYKGILPARDRLIELLAK
jgi:hypothetical protein